MKISASVYSNKDKTLDNLVKELDRYRVDFFHIDCNDDISVFEDIKQIRKISSTPIDLHIISPEPEKFFDGIIRTKTELVSFQFENLKSPLNIPKEISSKLGLAIVSDTAIDVFERYASICDFVLFMTTSPGKSGGTFNKDNFKKIRKFKTLFPATKVHVDGGVNDEVSFVLRNMGVSLIVSGSYLVNADYVGAALHNLKSDIISSHILVGDFMLGIEESPVLKTDNFSFYDVLKSIEDYNMGFTMIADSTGKLEGIITNADVRRGLLKMEVEQSDPDISGFIGNGNEKKVLDLNELNPVNIINRNPVKINQKNTVSELLQMVKSLKFPILYLPVVDDENRLVGTITFNNLIKGES